MRIRTADLSDLKEIARVEAACFPAAEAATEEEFEKRLTFYKDHFWLMFEEEKLIAFVDGMVTNQEDLTDEMYEKAEMHDEKGDWQMIFGVNTIPDYRKHGYYRCKRAGKKGTCPYLQGPVAILLCQVWIQK